jgi:hypothetical protein
MIELCTGVDVGPIALCSVTKLTSTPTQHERVHGDLLAFHAEYVNGTSHFSTPSEHS